MKKNKRVLEGLLLQIGCKLSSEPLTRSGPRRLDCPAGHLRTVIVNEKSGRYRCGAINCDFSGSREDLERQLIASQNGPSTGAEALGSADRPRKGRIDRPRKNQVRKYRVLKPLYMAHATATGQRWVVFLPQGYRVPRGFKFSHEELGIPANVETQNGSVPTSVKVKRGIVYLSPQEARPHFRTMTLAPVTAEEHELARQPQGLPRPSDDDLQPDFIA